MQGSTIIESPAAKLKRNQPAPIGVPVLEVNIQKSPAAKIIKSPKASEASITLPLLALSGITGKTGTGDGVEAVSAIMDLLYHNERKTGGGKLTKPYRHFKLAVVLR